MTLLGRGWTKAGPRTNYTQNLARKMFIPRAQVALENVGSINACCIKYIRNTNLALKNEGLQFSNTRAQMAIVALKMFGLFQPLLLGF